MSIKSGLANVESQSLLVLLPFKDLFIINIQEKRRFNDRQEVRKHLVQCREANFM